MANPDSEVRISTRIDNSKLSGDLRQTSKELDKLGASFDKQVASIKKQEAALDSLRRKMDAITAGEKAPASLVAMETQLRKNTAEIKQQEAAYDSLFKQYEQAEQRLRFSQQYGGNVDEARAEYERLSEELRSSGAELDQLKTKTAELAAKTKEVKLDPTQSAEWQELNDKLRLGEEALESSKNKARQLADEFHRAASQDTSNGIRKITKETKNAGTQAARSANAFEKLARRIKALVVAALVYQVIRSGLRDLREGIGNVLKANSEFMASLNSIKVNLLTAFAPLWEVIQPALISFMDVLAKATAIVAQFMAMIFGKTYQQAKDSAEALYDQAKAQDKVGSSADKAGKKLARFDEINQLGQDSAAGGGAGSEAKLDFGANQDLSFLESLKGPFDELLRILEPTIEALDRLWGSMERLKGFAWQGLMDFYNNFLRPVGGWVLGTGFPRFIDGLRWIIENVNWERLNDALAKFWKSLAPFAINVGRGLLWFWENVLTKFITWSLNNLIPRAFDSVSAALKVLNSVVDAAKPALMWLWEEMLKPAANWTGELILQALGWLKERLLALSDWIEAHQQEVTDFIKIVGLITLGFLAAKGAVFVFHGALNLLKGLLAVLASPAGVFVLIAAAITAIVIAAGNAGEMIEALRGIFKGFGEFISGVFAGDWEKAWKGIKDVFKGVFNAIVIILESAINLIIAGINELVMRLNEINIKMPDWVEEKFGVGSIGFKIKPIGTIKLPRLATGGIINQATVAMIGERGREAVLPLDNNTGWMDDLADRLALRISGMQGDKTPAVNITASAELGPLIRLFKFELDKESRRQGRQMSNRVIPT